MGSQPNLASKSEVVLIYKWPKNFGAPSSRMWGAKKNKKFYHYSRDFRTRHRISAERNIASTNKNTNFNLQCVPYKLTYFAWLLTQKRLRSVWLIVTHPMFLPEKFNLCQKKSATKFLCVKTSSSKVVATLFPYLTVHGWIAGDVPKCAIKVTHSMTIQPFPVIAWLPTQRPIDPGQPNFDRCYRA